MAATLSLPLEDESTVSLVRDDILFRVQRALRLIPDKGLGLARRTIFFVLLTWLPLALWALWKHRALPGDTAEPLFAHYSIHARLLVALPALILGEGLTHGMMTRLIPHFVNSGIISEKDRPR